MGQRKTPDNFYLVDLDQTRIRCWPLFGLNRLVRLQHRKRNGVLYCDNVLGISHSITFSNSNPLTTPYTISYRSPVHGVVSEPRLNVPNEAPEADLRRFRDDGTKVVFSFTPKRGETYTLECDMYKALDWGNRFVQLRVDNVTRIDKWELTLDVSAYLRAGFTVVNPRCEYESDAADDCRKPAARGRARRLSTVEKGTGVWGWSIASATCATVRMAWEFERSDEAIASQSVNLERLGTELSINPRMAKDLHNFVMICHYYVAGFRSLNTIGRGIMTDKSVLNRSIEFLEELVGKELIERTKGKGLIRVTPTGEAVIDWWSQFYMRWTPIFPEPYIAKRTGRPRGDRKS